MDEGKAPKRMPESSPKVALGEFAGLREEPGTAPSATADQSKSTSSSTQPATSIGLPKSWKRTHDAWGHMRYIHSTGLATYRNPWYLLYDTPDHDAELGELPPGWELRRISLGVPFFHYAPSNTTYATDPRRLPDGWKLDVDQQSSKIQVWFVNESIGTKTRRHPYTAKIGGEAFMPVPDGWEVRFTPNGNNFFVNHKKKSIHWDHPLNPQISDLCIAPDQCTWRLGLTSPGNVLYWIYTPSQECHWIGPGEQERICQPHLLGELPQACEIRMASNFRYFIVDHNSKTTFWAKSPDMQSLNSHIIDPDDGFGPLPAGFAKIFTHNGFPVFVDTHTSSGSRVDPRLRLHPPGYFEAHVPLPELPVDAGYSNPVTSTQIQPQSVSQITPDPDLNEEPSDSENEGEIGSGGVNLSFKYPALTVGQIRLLDVQPSSKQDVPVECTLRCVSLSEMPMYDALSYTWGSRSNETTVAISNQPFLVRQNAEAALRRLRLPQAKRSIWIDAICINQNDKEEKAVQLPMMTQIYSSAQQVCVWLGEETEGSLLAMDKLQNTHQSFKAGLHQRKVDKKHGKLLLPFRHQFFGGGGSFQDSSNRAVELHTGEIRELLARPWWNRAWIMQEAIVGQKLLLICGGATLDWDEVSEWRHRSRQETSSGTDLLTPFGLNTAKAYDILDGFYRTLHNFRQRWSDNKRDASIYDLLYRFRHLGCSDKRDRIYAFLGLASLVSEPAFKPDYSKSVRDVYKDFARAIIQHSGSLDILNYKREWKGVQPRKQPVYAYSMIDQAKYHDIFADVRDAEGKKPRKAWARLPEGWERRQEQGDKAFSYYDWNEKQKHENSPLRGKPPTLAHHVGEQKICPPGWRKEWDDLGRARIYYNVPAHSSPDSAQGSTAERFKLPSWVPNWSRPTDKDPSPLLEPNGTDGQFSAGRPGRIHLDNSNLDVLRVKGVNFDRIARIANAWHPESDETPMSRQGITVLQEWETLALAKVAKCPYGTEKERKNALWRTHIADYPEEDASPDVYRLHLECWYDSIGWSRGPLSYKDLAGKSIIRTAIIDTKYQSDTEHAMRDHFFKIKEDEWQRKLDAGEWSEAEMKKDAIVKYFQEGAPDLYKTYGILANRIFKVCSHRALFVTERGYMGLAPWNAAVGDVVAVLDGGKTPFLLRERQRRAGHYALVGESYVYGIMATEAFDLGLEVVDFVLT